MVIQQRDVSCNSKFSAAYTIYCKIIKTIFYLQTNRLLVLQN